MKAVKTQLRLNSAVRNGVSGPEAGAIDLIYMYLLAQFSMQDYRYISINQIGEDLNEVILKHGKEINMNIRYPTVENFAKKNTDEKNLIRLQVVHAGLVRIAEHDKKLDIAKLEAIRDLIIARKFSFDFTLKSFVSKHSEKLVTKIIVHPEMDRFDFFVVVEEEGKPICRTKIYTGMTTYHYFPFFFNSGKWINANELIITGKKKEVEIHVLLNECLTKVVNLTPYPKPPTFEMFRSGSSDVDRDQAYKDWLHSLPPEISGSISSEPN